MALSTNRPPDNIPVSQVEVDRDVELLNRAGQGKLGTDEVCMYMVIPTSMVSKTFYRWRFAKSSLIDLDLI